MYRLTVLVDLDDTIEDLLGAWVGELNKRFGTCVGYNDIASWEIGSYFTNLTENQIYSPLLEGEFWEKVKIKPGAKEYIERLIDDGHKVVVVTASHPDTISHKLNKVLFKNLPFLSYKDVIIAHRKQMIKGDILVDDNPVNLLNGDYQGILVDMPHNKSYKAEKHGLFRAKDWKEIYDIISELSVMKEIN